MLQKESFAARPFYIATGKIEEQPGERNGQGDNKMMVYGYIRVSSRDQKEDRQQIALREVGVAHQNIYADK